MENKELKNVHTVEIYNRERIDITTALEVISSTDKEVIVKLIEGVAFISGQGMTIARLSPEDGLLSVVGKISGIRYENKLSKKSFLKKVFK